VNGTVGALRYLLLRSIANRTRTQLRRIRSPRYAVALIAAALYFWSLTSRGGVSRGPSAADAQRIMPMIYEVLLAVMTIGVWIFGPAEPALVFSGAEVQMLFPAPVSRRALINYKLAQTQFTILFSALIWQLLLSRTSTAVPVLHALGLWALFTTLYLHRVGASFVRVDAAQGGRAGLRKHALPIAVVVLAVIAVVWTVAADVPALAAGLQDGTLGGRLLALRNDPLISIVLWPFHALVAPVFARTTAAWSATIGWALVLLLLSYLWVIRTGVQFEEAAVRKSERLAAQRAARRTRGSFALKASRPWLSLAPTGRPAIAIAWKNMVAFQRLLPITRVTLIVLLAVVVASGTLPGMHLGWAVVRAAALGLAGLLILFGPLYVRTDLHQDMLMLSLLRSYPLSGFAIVAAELGGTLALLLAMQAVLLLVGFPALAQMAGTARALPITVAGIFAVPAITALRVAVANAWVVLLPGWVHLGAGRAAGIEALGQNLVTILGSMIAHLLLLIVPTVAALLVGRLLSPELGYWAYVPAAMLGAFFAAVELWGITGWLGQVLMRTDPSDVDAVSA
jgi:hypothetical protein